jgi:hypothetical protein
VPTEARVGSEGGRLAGPAVPPHVAPWLQGVVLVQGLSEVPQTTCHGLARSHQSTESENRGRKFTGATWCCDRLTLEADGDLAVLGAT